MPSGTPPQGRGMRFGAAACSDHSLSWHFLLIYPWCVPSLEKVGCQSAGSGVWLSASSGMMFCWQ
eukprot:13791782-Alexandrium_andersonii.AAC.1